MKDRIRNSSYCILLGCILLLNSCGKVPSELANGTCILPVEKIAYPIGISPYPEKEISQIGPLGSWQFQASLPEPSEKGDASQLVARSSDLWILPLFSTKAFRYSTDTDEWQIYNTIDGFTVVPQNIFLAEDGTLWGFGTITKNLDSQINISFLSQYNENNDQFEFVQDTDGLLDEILVISFPARLSEDDKGIFWFFGSLPGGDDVGLYSFDPSTRKATKHLSLPIGFVYAGPVVDRDGIIWFYHGEPEEGQLLKYSPTTHRIQPYIGLPNFDELGDISLLFFDQEGNLWLDNKGWLDFTSDPANPVWYKMIQSPVFLTDRGGGEAKYGWLTPFHISQSSNGWFWFTTIDGTIRLDLKRGEWCKFTTGSSPVVEDKDGNLWVVVFDKLYKYQAEQ